MNRLGNNGVSLLRRLLWAVIGVLLVSCDGIFDGEGDCSVVYRMTFRYDRNMKFADAFANEVSSVTLFAFAPDGRLVARKSETVDPAEADDYAMTLELEPGFYDFVAWCGVEEGLTPWHLTQSEDSGLTDKERLLCALECKRSEEGTAYTDQRFEPALFYGSLDNRQIDTAEGVHTLTMPLTKDTNRVCVVLQHLSGEPVDPQAFAVTVTDKNGTLRCDNTPDGAESVVYRPWYVAAGTAEMEENAAPESVRNTDPDADRADSRAVTAVSAAVAELTVGRLVTENRPILRVTDSAGETVLAIPLIDYALLVKGHYREMSDQEYLDCQDEYVLTFFLDENDRWASSHIIINSWRVVPDSVDFE